MHQCQVICIVIMVIIYQWIFTQMNHVDLIQCLVLIAINVAVNFVDVHNGVLLVKKLVQEDVFNLVK